MSETKRRTPALFERALGEYQPVPRYIAFPEFEQPPPPANPVISIRLGQDILARPEAFVVPQRLPFPYWQAPAPANPVIVVRSAVLPVVPEVVTGMLGEPRYVTFPFGGAGAPTVSVGSRVYRRYWRMTRY